MPWWTKCKSSQAGVTVIELLVGLAIFLIVGVAIFSLLQSSLKVVNADQNRSTALAIARKKLEIIKNLPYDSVGLVGGIPSGTITSIDNESLNHINYTVSTDIRYVDDSFDDVAPTDTLNTDYKRVSILVTWDQAPNGAPVELVTNIVPTGIETTATGGTLWIEVYDPTTDPITHLKNATVTITAPSLSISITGNTDSDGRYIVPGMPPATEAYHVVVTKPVYYGIDQTYTRDATTNPNPNPADLSIASGEVTTEYFQISQKVNLLSVHEQRADNHNNVDVPFQVHGAKTIGTDGEGLPIYKYNETITPNNGGNAQLQELESDTYTFLFDEATIDYVVAGYDHILPYAAQPQSSENITFDLADYEPYTALFTITDATGVPIDAATVTLGTTTLTTDINGQAFFSGLISTTYTLTVSKSSYTTYTGTAIVNGNEQQSIGL